MEKKEVITVERGQEMPGPHLFVDLVCDVDYIRYTINLQSPNPVLRYMQGFFSLTRPLWSAWCFPLLQKGNRESEKLLLVQNLSTEI